MLPLVAWFAIWIWRVDPGSDLWAVSGHRPDAFTRLTVGRVEEYQTLIANDSFLAVVLGFLLVGIVVKLWQQEDDYSRVLLVALGLFAVSYSLAELVENHRLGQIVARLGEHSGAGSPAPPSVDALRDLDTATLAKWLLAIGAGFTLIALLQRRPPASPLTTWGNDPAAPPPLEKDATTWGPHDKRFAISVTGGGIRAASFALGVFQELTTLGLLQHARYVTSVSGGGYTAGALTALNQDGRADPPALAQNSPELQRLRRSLGYIATDWHVLAGALTRVVFGVLLNLALLYLLLFAMLRPVGWLIGSPMFQDGLRVQGPVAVDVERHTDDPDEQDDPTGATYRQPWHACDGMAPDGQATDPASTVMAPQQPTNWFRLSSDPNRIGRVVDVVVPGQCIVVVEPPSTAKHNVFLVAEPETRAVIALEDGKVSIERQPVYSLTVAVPSGCKPDSTTAADECALLGRFEASDVVKIIHPMLKVSNTAVGLASLDEAVGFIEIHKPLDVQAKTTLERRGNLDVDARHWQPGLALLAVAALLLAIRVIGRPDSWRLFNALFTISSLAGVGWLLLTVVLPWLALEVPALVLKAMTTAPSAEAWSGAGLGQIGGSSLAPNLLAWPVLAIASVLRWMRGRNTTPASTKPTNRGTRALLGKVVAMLRSLAIGVVLVATGVSTGAMILAAAAADGPWGRLTNLGNTSMAPDLLWWAVIVLGLLLMRGFGEAGSWSPSPIYKRRLSHAFAWQRVSGGRAERREYSASGGSPDWADLARRAHGRLLDRAGYLDGYHGDGTEHVLCCAANVLGEDLAPTGRRAVSFTISRSWIGGPEVGWIDTPTYVGRLGRRRAWDFTLPGAVAISGAAATPAMGKKEIGPIGSLLAMLNVRLGAWLPHPRYVANMANPKGRTGKWEHNPGWPWFVREVLRRFKADAPYLYVSDGGHWENLGLVEALRRGACTVVAISASGDGELSHGTIGDAVEIARTDLGVEIQLDQIWRVRSVLGGDDPGPTTDGLQYVLDPGPNASVGRMSPAGFAFGTFTYPSGEKGQILVIDATMVGGLAVDVHAYAESRSEFPHVSTGDQLFTDRDFESYRVLGRTLAKHAFADTPAGANFLARISSCTRDNT